jgi:hypothetical protein
MTILAVLSLFAICTYDENKAEVKNMTMNMLLKWQ